MAEPTQPAAPSAQPALPPAGPDEVALTIDGRPLVVKKGTTVLQAAEKVGLLVPHYCYHPGLSVAGNCRMCLVEIEKMPKLQIGCATQAAQGMVVRTANERVARTRQGIMEFLLINHPLDCPICDQAGECRLQQYEAAYGAGFSRFNEEKVHAAKRESLGRHVMFDGERCIKCTRCIRFCDEVSRSHELGLLERGDHAIIGTFPGKPLDNPYSGNTVDICPVGALTLKEFRFKARVWFLKDVPSVCAGCARGCNVNLATYRNQIHRMTPRFNAEVNEYWICDPGRLSYQALEERPRLAAPLVRKGSSDAAGPHLSAGGASAGAASAVTASAGSAPADAWSGALDAAAALLRGVAQRSGGQTLAALVSARLSVEDLFMARRVLQETIGISRVAVPAHEEGDDDRFLIRRDKTPNGRGAALVGVGAPHAGRMKEILEDLAAGRVRGLVVVGEDPIGDGLLTEAARRNLDALVVVDWWRSPTAEAADVALPSCGYGEAEGVFVNFEGRAQRVRAAIRPAGQADPVWRILAALGNRFGLSGDYPSASRLFDEVASSTPVFAGLSYRALGEPGVRLKEA